MSKKRLLAILLTVALVFATAACASESVPKKKSASKDKTDFDAPYTETTITRTQKGEVTEVDVPYEILKKKTVKVVDSGDIHELTIENGKAVQTDFKGLNSVYQGFIFIPDKTKLNRTYNQKMIDRELQRIDEMDITLLRSYYEPSYAYVGGDPLDPKSWDFSKKNPNMYYLYQWLDALQKRGVDVGLNMGWSFSDLYNKTTSINSENPFYALTYGEILQGYAYWYAESIKWIVEKYGYTNVKYTFNFTEPLYYTYGMEMRQELGYWADEDVQNLIRRKNPAESANPMMMAKIGDTSYVTNAKTFYTKERDENGKYIQVSPFPKFFDIKTGEEHILTKADKDTARLYTSWDMWLDTIGAADKQAKKIGVRKYYKTVGPDVALGGHIQMSYQLHKEEDPRDDIKWWINHANHLIDIYAFHYYVPHWPGVGGLSTFYDDDYDMLEYYFDMFLDTIKPTGKPFWFDEFNYNTDTGENRQHYDDINAENPLNPNKFAQATIAMMNTGIQTGLTWQLFDTVWPARDSNGDEFVNGIHVIGMAPAMCQSSVPYISYYGFTLLTKYCGMDKSTTYNGVGENALELSMVKYKKNGKTHYSIIVLNMNLTERQVSINLQKSLGGVKMYRYLYNPFDVTADSTATMIGADACFSGVKDCLQDTVPSLSFAIYSTEYNP